MLKRSFHFDGKTILRVIWLGAIIVVVLASLLPANSMPLVLLGRLHIWDKAEHYFAYLVLTLLPSVHERRVIMFLAAAGAITLGIAMEYGQLYSGWRDFEMGDILADTMGAFSGAAAGIPIRSIGFMRLLR